MSAPKVNVLASELRHMCGHDSRSVDGCVTCEAADGLEQRDAAVAELIEADREFDAAADALAAAKREKGSWRTNPLGDGHPAVLRMREAKARRTTALARIGGAE